MTVATVDVLAWLGHVILEHNSHPDVRGRSTVSYPSALPERERWTPLIRQILESEDGVLVDATTCGRGVDCGEIESDAPSLTDKVREILREYNLKEPNAGLKLEISDRRAIIVGLQDYESVNAAQRAIREVLTAVCADDLRSTDLAALIYAEDSLDDLWSGVVWRLLMQLPKLLALGSEATTIVIAGDGSIDFDVHCAGDPSLRARLLDGGGLLERHRWEQSRRQVVELQRVDGSRLPLLVLFLGAGASVTDGLPTGDTLRNQALGRLLGRSVDRGNFEQAALDWREELAAAGELSAGELGVGDDEFVRTLTLERVIEQEQRQESQTFSTTLREFSERHESVIEKLRSDRRSGLLVDDALASLVKRQQRLVLVTVNFDHVIEERVDASLLKKFVTETDMGQFQSYLEEYRSKGGAVPLLKLHGDIGLPETIVANTSQTQAGLSTARDQALTSLITQLERQAVRYWWYVGYSMRDRDLETTWRSPRFLEFAERWVSPFLDPFVSGFIEEHRLLGWEGKGRTTTAMKRLVSLTASDFFVLLDTEVASRWPAIAP